MDVVALRESWARVSSLGRDTVALYFYSHLALSHPDVREMFPVGMAGQRHKFVTAMGTIVANFDRVDQLGPYLAKLGRDHVAFGTRAEHFGPVCESLLATLAHFEGVNWTRELSAAWAHAYQVISSMMIEAAQEVPTGSVADRGHGEHQ